MKKQYIAPVIRQMETETEDLMELSLVNDTAADNSDALSRENNSWIRDRNLWDEE